MQDLSDKTAVVTGAASGMGAGHIRMSALHIRSPYLMEATSL